MENELIIIPEENIFLEFFIGNQMYAVISDCTQLSKDGEIYFVKIDFLNEQKIARNIESEKEYKEVEKEYERILNQY